MEAAFFRGRGRDAFGFEDLCDSALAVPRRTELGDSLQGWRQPMDWFHMKSFETFQNFS